MARILLADADAFFVGVARLADPEGAGQAPLLIVGGSRDSRGVVCSASYETRKFGVRSSDADRSSPSSLPQRDVRAGALQSLPGEERRDPGLAPEVRAGGRDGERRRMVHGSHRHRTPLSP